MANKMLIDASHREETRVVVLRGNRIEEFDFESESRKQLRGNIYLARVTRVEPSLQAAFVEYGGNRHGFLAFSEIHPDYYQIPVADRQALIAQDAAVAREEDEDENGNGKEDRNGKKRRRGRGKRGNPKTSETVAKAAAAEDRGAEDSASTESDHNDTATDAAEDEASEASNEEVPAEPDDSQDNDGSGSSTVMSARIPSESISEPVSDKSAEADDDHGEDEDDSAQEEQIESVGAEDALEELPDRRRMPRRQYKIQEVIKRRQILLVQVVKEERGNKGAALTTYLSLAGRYSVLMPNTARGGGISRKITQMQDRKRLKEIVHELEVPDGMGVILRTAGANRTKAEIKRDYEYLMRLWENVRNLTLQSTAPCLVYEEGSLIKRAIRDLYNKDIDEITVAGDEGYREAKDFMRMLMPSHAKVVQPYREAMPIFARAGIEAQLDKMLQPQVTLKSGGYIIINQTEALVSIDVNSGRSTREHSIEDTALQTNLEAAEEVARQLRLRDLAGLIVIDFIDMDEKRNNRSVEKRIKDCLKQDRARIQVGRISHFGLLEMSRQRIRASVLESSMKPCPHCGGIGMVRSDSSEALYVIRSIEDYLLKNPGFDIKVRTSTHTALYILNQKRANIHELESRFGLRIVLEADETLGHQHYAIDRGEPASGIVVPRPELPKIEEPDEPEIAAEAEEEEVQPRQHEATSSDGEGEGGRKRKRRRRRRRGRDRFDQSAEPGGSDRGTAGEQRLASGSKEDGLDDEDAEAEDEVSDAQTEEASDQDEADDQPKKRRRGKRGGRRNRREEDDTAAEASDEKAGEALSEPVVEAIAEEADDKPRKPRASRAKRKAGDVKNAAEVEETSASAPAIAGSSEPETLAIAETPEKEKPSRRRPSSAAIASEPVVISAGVKEEAEASAGAEEGKPKRAGWWLKRGFL